MPDKDAYASIWAQSVQGLQRLHCQIRIRDGLPCMCTANISSAQEQILIEFEMLIRDNRTKIMSQCSDKINEEDQC